MTTSEDRAQRIVGGVIDRLTTDKSGLPVATRITQALDADGLLAPEMQEEWGCEWDGVGVVHWHSDKSRAKFDLNMGYPFFVKKGSPIPEGRILHRYVTAAEKEEQP